MGWRMKPTEEAVHGGAAKKSERERESSMRERTRSRRKRSRALGALICWWCSSAEGAPVVGRREGDEGRRLTARGFGRWMTAAIWLGGDGSGGIPRWKK